MVDQYIDSHHNPQGERPKKHTVDIIGIGITKASLAVAVTTAPLVEAVELLGVMAGLDVLSEILAIKTLVHSLTPSTSGRSHT